MKQVGNSLKVNHATYHMPRQILLVQTGYKQKKLTMIDLITSIGLLFDELAYCEQ